MTNKNTPQELGKELVESSAVAGAVKREADAFKHGSFTTQKTLDTQPAEKPLSEWEQIVLKLIDGELEVIEQKAPCLSFNYNNNEYTAWIPDYSFNVPSFGSIHRVNDERVDEIVEEKTQIRPEIQEKLKVFVKPTDNEILQKFEQEHFKL